MLNKKKILLIAGKRPSPLQALVFDHTPSIGKDVEMLGRKGLLSLKQNKKHRSD